MVEAANKKIDYLGQLEFPRVCLIGNTGTGKSALANAICGKELFRASESFESCTSEVKQEQAKWEGKGNSFYIVDTCGFGDSKDGDETQMNEFVVRLKGFFYVNLFVLVFNGQSPRFDKLTQEMLKAFKQILGEKVFEHICVVFTRWDYDSKSLRDRKKNNLTEESREKEFNQHLKEKIQINTDKYPIKCFFVDSSSFVDPENDDEKALTRLRKEFDKLKEACFSSGRFLCIDLKEYESGKKKIEEGQLELQKIEYEKKLLEEKLNSEKFKNEKKLQEMLAKFEKSQFQARYERQKAIVRKIDEYFEYRPEIPKDSTPLKCLGMVPKSTLYKDLAQILIDFNKNDHEDRFSQQNYQKVLVAELNSRLPTLIEKRVIQIIHDEFKEFVREFPMLPRDIMATSLQDMNLDINAMVGDAVATSFVLTAASLGLVITSALGVAAMEGAATAAGALALGVGSLAAATGGLVLVVLVPFVLTLWSREGVLNKLIPVAFQNYSENREFRTNLKSFAERAFDIAADKYYTKIGNEIALPE